MAFGVALPGLVIWSKVNQAITIKVLEYPHMDFIYLSATERTCICNPSKGNSGSFTMGIGILRLTFGNS